MNRQANRKALLHSSNSSRFLRVIIFMFLLNGIAVAQIGGGYNLEWNTIDNGGEMVSTGGGYEVAGTMGQKDTEIIVGGDYKLEGGFWPGAVSCPSIDPVLLDPYSPGTSCCVGGDSYGLACMICNGGGRDGEKCMDSGDCTGGGVCETNDTLCSGSACGGVTTVLGVNTIGWPKSRYIGVQPNPTTAGIPTAIRVKMIDINGNANCNGEVRWAGPPVQFCEGGACTTLFYGSQLQTTPHWIDWTTVGVVQLYGEEVIPDSRYAIQMISKQCEFSIDNESFYSSPALMVDSAKWGDVIRPMFPFTAAAQPAISDVLKLVDKWLGNLEPRKSRSQLQPAVIDPSASVGIADVLKGVDAWLGTPYPFSITTCP